ncbi:MCE family protein [Rhodococcus sp. NPDC059968]|uniref:MCE family protein n=1 Tax=Rhodococcus sp. NPDC059968 TaxID=3347017 RepID=UPI00366BE1FB
MRPFSDRNPVKLGLAGAGGMIVALVLVFNYESVPGIDNSDRYVAQFADTGGLYTGDGVQISGVDVGTVTDIELRGDHVDVTFTADPKATRLGSATSAAIKVETVLGRRFLDVEPRGDGELEDGDTIPLDRTTSAYDPSDAISDLTDQLSDTDVPQVESALDSVSHVIDELSPDLRASVEGVARLSETVSSRDSEIRRLFTESDALGGILATRNEEFTKLLGDGRVLFDVLNQRAAAIDSILGQVQKLSDELSGLAQENEATIGPMLDELHAVLTTLNNNRDNLDLALQRVHPFARQLGEALGSGPFVSFMLQNILPTNLQGQLPGSLGGPHR